MTRGMLDNLNRALIGFEDLFQHANQSYPPYNIVKSGGDFHLEMAVSGFDKSEITIKSDNGYLIVTGARKEAKPDSTRQYLVRSLASRNFQHRFYLSDELEVGTVKLVNGVLDIHLKSVKPHHVEKTYEIA